MQIRSMTVTDPAAIDALNHPIRRDVLDALRDSDTAANVARSLGLSRQKVNYHLKELARVGLVAERGERRKGHLIEKLYEAVAGSYLISPLAAVSDERRERALQDQVSLHQLVSIGVELQKDAVGLLDRAAYDDEQIPSASVLTEISFKDETARSDFLEAYLKALGSLVDRYGSKQGQAYRLAMAVYPHEETIDG